MKVTVVPAQVTTVEDRIIGNLGFSQMILLIIPIFVSAALFAMLPPFMGSATYKYIVMGMFALICCILAIRIQGRILVSWLVMILRYNVRPKYYLFNKNTTSFRQDYPPVAEPNVGEKTNPVTGERTVQPRLTTPETVRVLTAIDNPAVTFRFETTKKGGLHVRLTEIEE